MVELRAAGNWLPKIVVASELQLAHGISELAAHLIAAPLLDVIPTHRRTNARALIMVRTRVGRAC